MKIHIVKKGDTLYELSKKYGITLEKLIDANPQLVDPNKLDIGAKIKIPTEPIPVPDGAAPVIHKHTVKQGDSLWKLSKAWGVSLKEMIDANPQLKNPNALLVGEVVNIPSAGMYTGAIGGPQAGMGSGAGGEKTVVGSQMYTGPKEKMTAPKPVPEVLEVEEEEEEMEIEVKPEITVIPEVKVYPEVIVKPEITVMPELIVMPEMPKMPEVIEKTVVVEKECEPITQYIPMPCPEAQESVSPCSSMPDYTVVAPAPSPCGCGSEMPVHEWEMTQPTTWHPQYTYPMQHQAYMAPSSHYPGITEMPNTEQYTVSVNEPYNVEKEMSTEVSGYPMAAMTGAHHYTGHGPMHYVHGYGHGGYNHGMVPSMPVYGGVPIGWPQYGGYPMHMMGAGAGSWPVSGAHHYHKKDCGCHGRQEEALTSGDPAFTSPETVQAITSDDTSASILNSEDRTKETTKKVEAKVSRQGKPKSKVIEKKERNAVKKAKRTNPWIKR